MKFSLVTKNTFVMVFLIVSAVVYSAQPILVDQNTGKYLENLGATQHSQNSVNNPFGQHGNQHLQDSINKRNNSIGRHGNQHLQDSMNKRNNPIRYNAVIVKIAISLWGKRKCICKIVPIRGITQVVNIMHRSNSTVLVVM